MGLFDEFINIQASGIAALFGSYRTMPFSKEHNDKFLSSLKPGTIIAQGPVKANYVAGCIQGAAGGSFWTHIVFYAGRHGGELIRKRWAEEGKSLIRKEGKKFVKIPFPELTEHEFIEATYPTVRIGNLEKDYGNDETQQIAFIMDMDDETLYKIMNYLYSKEGTSYDFSEIFSDLLPQFQIGHHKNRHVCSSLVASALNLAGKSIIPSYVSAYEAYPKHVHETLYGRYDIPIAKWNLE